MSSIEDKLSKLREERMARQKARIDKLRQLNLKKYNNNDQPKSSKSGIRCPNNNMNVVKHNVHVNDTTKRPISAIPKKTINFINANKNITSLKLKVVNVTNHKKANTSKVIKSDNDKIVDDRKHNPLQEIGIKYENKDISKINQLTVTKDRYTNKCNIQQKMLKNKAVVKEKLNDVATNSQSAHTNSEGESVYDRLCKPKVLPKVSKNDNAQIKLQTDPNYLKKLIKESNIIMASNHTVFEPKVVIPIRRSLSAIHFENMSKDRLTNRVKNWVSIGEKIDKVHLQDINEDDKEVVSGIKFKFQTPSNFNTPRSEELESSLKSWLHKSGKSLESYRHLQCFGVKHSSQELTPNILDTLKYDGNVDENKENIALEHDSDNESFHENINKGNDDVAAENKFDSPVHKWRGASSYSSDSDDLNESRDSNTISSGTMHHVDEVLVRALEDLTHLLHEGYEWEQCARWLRMVRERFPSALDLASYWECRAALEESRGDLPASMQCWEQAVANGTQQYVADANLDSLLDKFMQLNITPTSVQPKVNPKLVDVKNVFKSTIIRFGVQQAKLHQSNEPVKYTVTPVRRSSRLSVYRQTPFRVCATLQEAAELGPIKFVQNLALSKTP